MRITRQELYRAEVVIRLNDQEVQDAIKWMARSLCQDASLHFTDVAVVPDGPGAYGAELRLVQDTASLPEVEVPVGKAKGRKPDLFGYDTTVQKPHPPGCGCIKCSLEGRE
jgi:hypothetical protein